jgi:hypothetical protein
MEPNHPRNKLDKMSRMNYAKVYTVEHNVKVAFIGNVVVKHLNRVIQDHARIVSLDTDFYPEDPSDNMPQPQGYDDVPSQAGYLSLASQPRTTESYGGISFTPMETPYTMAPQQPQPEYGEHPQTYGNPTEADTEGQHQYDGSLYEE